MAARPLKALLLTKRGPEGPAGRGGREPLTAKGRMARHLHLKGLGAFKIRRTYFPRPTSPKGRAGKVLVLLGEHSSPKPPRAT